MNTSRLLNVIVAFCLAAAAAPAATFNLSTATIADINAAMDAGALTSEKLLGLYLKRIEAFDRQGPKVNSVIAINPKALEEARALDLEGAADGAAWHPRGREGSDRCRGHAHDGRFQALRRTHAPAGCRGRRALAQSRRHHSGESQHGKLVRQSLR
jgi:hypothetical protein